MKNEHTHLFCDPDVNEVESPSFEIQIDRKSEAYKSSCDNNSAEDIRRIASILAHEIRNPLTTVKGFLQLLKPHLTEIGKDLYAEVAIEELNRANDIINDFLSAYKPDNEVLEKTKMNDILKTIVLFFEGEASIKNIHILTSFSSSNAKLSINPKKFKQVLVNIIKNAIEAIGEAKGNSGKIHIKSDVNNNTARITILDDGYGMSSETLSQIYVPFYTTKEKGTGIGLALCKTIIEENGGKILIRSKEKFGTEITITLPLIGEDSRINNIDSKVL